MSPNFPLRCGVKVKQTKWPAANSRLQVTKVDDNATIGVRHKFQLQASSRKWNTGESNHINSVFADTLYGSWSLGAKADYTLPG